MAFFLKTMVGGQMKNLGGEQESEKEDGDGKETAESKGMTREESEEYQRQLVEEKIERDNMFAYKKAERATLRVQLRDKYRLPKSERDESQIQMVGGDVDVPEELAKMVEEDEEEEANDTFLGKLQNMDFDTIKNKAQESFIEMKQTAEEKCSLM
ncbi:complexin-4c [Latimeria chalumnae]|uniref:complexin-4c n=1 Tax=Latimeria chalumnae TaxID=7897 RepID=UPI0003C17B4B|nr:PREDICTED: complexin-4-like [Latimeria chalumnae]|eukprot:XP_005999114.1 PREDICTED: complexin-4-like [Latimeria chalumnae]